MSIELTVSGDVDGPRRDVDVHEIIDDSTLNVTLVFVNQNLLSSVKNLKQKSIFIFVKKHWEQFSPYNLQLSANSEKKTGEESNLDKTVVGFCNLVNSLVLKLVMLDPLREVGHHVV